MNRLTRSRLLRVSGALGAQVLFPSIQTAAAADSYTMRMTVSTAATSIQVVSALHFAAAVQRRSNGQLKIEVYPNSQLVKEAESIDGMTTGVVDFAIQTSAYLQGLFPRFQAFDTPFLFKNISSVYRVLDGPIGEECFADLETKGIVGLTWGFTGFREIETISKPVTVPEDMKGLRVRIAGGAVPLAAYQALGALPIQIGDSEFIPAIEQRVVDTIDVPVNGFTSFKLYTFMKHMAMSNHVFTLNPLMVSKRRLESLPAPLQRIVKEEGRSLGAFWRSQYVVGLTENLGILKKNGVVFTEIQYPAFRKAVEPVYAIVQAKVGGNLLERIGRAANG